jgi:predicted RNase H-like nuclease (RuvC/YqgF family)
MESFLSLAPAKTQTDDFQDWLTVLQEIKKLHANLEKVQETNRSLRNEIAGYKETNYKMRQTIERLKSLDLQMEEKRSLMK